MSESGSYPTTMTEALEWAGRAFPERGFKLFDSRGRSFERRTFPEIVESVRGAAARWRGLGLQPGEPVLVCLPTSWDFFECWLGAMWCGALPVAVAPPGGFGIAEAQVQKVEALVKQLKARFAVASPRFIGQASERGAEMLSRVGISVDDLAAAPVGSPDVAAADPADCAFLQLTSGSTGVPRAVMISHAGGLANVAGIDVALGQPDRGRVHTWCDALVGWLPLHHDMGLIGYVLLSIVTGIDLRLFPPNVFLARPHLWLWEIATCERAVTNGPNFGYQLCVERVAEKHLTGLDLSGWAAANTGAEMVRAETIAGFVEKFGPYGFRPEVFRPCYGMAESTVCVSLDVVGRGLRTKATPGGSPDGEGAGGDAIDVACVGAPITDTEVEIRDDDGRDLGEGRVGEIWVRGPALFLGYYNDEESTRETLVDGWLRTGDLGFLADGELHITGRIKDILILRGTNFMPHEIEWLGESVAGGGGALRSAAFSVEPESRGEEAVLVVEVAERDPDRRAEMERQIRLDAAHTLGIQLADVVLVRRGTVPKTTSGKVQRGRVRELYLRGEFGHGLGNGEGEAESEA